MNELLQPRQTNPPPKKFWFSAHLVLGIVFLVAVASAIIAGIFCWQTFSQIPASIQTPVHKAQDTTANWKTYTNSQYGFNFEYPTEMSIYSDSGDSVVITQSGKGSQINIWVFPEISDPTYYPSEQNPPLQLNKKIISNSTWYNYSSTSQDCNSNDIYQTKLSNGIIQFNFSTCLGYAYKELGILEDKSVENQILSTFKFTK
jgi:hypothetical protein